jgi:hypothetical protein
MKRKKPSPRSMWSFFLLMVILGNCALLILSTMKAP